MAHLCAQMAQHYAVAAKTCNAPQKGGRRNQKGKGQVALQQALPSLPQKPGPPSNRDKEDNPSFTTVMLKNVPLSYNRELLIMTLDEAGFHKLYNFVYLPVEFKKK